MATTRLRLPFTLVACDRCGEERPAGGRCQKCGSTTSFDDPDVDRRRRVIDRVRPILDGPGRSRKRLKPGDAFGLIGSFIDPFLKACAGVTEGSEDEAAARLAAAIGTLREVEDRVAASPRASKDARAWATFDGVIASLRVVVEGYFAALTAADPSSCQRYAAPAQRSLDAAGQIAAALGVEIQQEAERRSLLERGLMLGAVGGWVFGHHRS